MTFVVFEIKVLKEIVYRIRFNRNIVVSGGGEYTVLVMFEK